MRPEDISKISLPTDPRAEPNGRRVFFTVSRADIDDDRYHRAIWIHDEEGARPFTSGPGDTNPRWSPDAKTLAFLRTPDGSKHAQLAVMPVAGGEARVLTDLAYGLEAVEWSPDGSRILVVGVTPSEEWEDVDEDERTRRPRRITTVPYRYDQRGWLDDRRRHLWLIDPSGDDQPKCLTPGDFDEEFPAWSPDGSKIAFITDRDPRRGLVAGKDVYEVEAATGEQTRAMPRGWWSSLSYRPDGVLHALGSPGAEYPAISCLHRVEPDGSVTNLTASLDRGSTSLAAGEPFIRWDGDTALVGLERSGAFGVVRVPPDGEPSPDIDDECQISGLDVEGGRLVFTAIMPDNPGEVGAYSPGHEELLTSLNAPADLGVLLPEQFTVPCEGGETELDVWVILPEGDDVVPILLNIHGGPASQYGHAFFDEFQVYASAGYGVVYCNPRGSAGRGHSFLRAVTGEGWGVVDLADIRVAVSAALERYDRLDPDRMGIMGGSYGGFLTAWVIGHEDRWKSAVVERALISWPSFSGTSDIGGVFPHSYTGIDYPDAWQTWWEMSPLSLADQVTTPTLILHAEDDYRCPIEQAEQYFMALLRNGTPTDLLRFPGEGHEMSRSGQPRHRIERFNAILAWHDRHLKG